MLYKFELKIVQISYSHFVDLNLTFQQKWHIGKFKKRYGKKKTPLNGANIPNP